MATSLITIPFFGGICILPFAKDRLTNAYQDSKRVNEHTASRFVSRLACATADLCGGKLEVLGFVNRKSTLHSLYLMRG